jgi:hypothetical protein
MKVVVLERIARPKHRPNRTFSRLFIPDLSVSVMEVARAEARHGAMCERRQHVGSSTSAIERRGEGIGDMSSSGGGFQPAVQRTANAVAAHVR